LEEVKKRMIKEKKRQQSTNNASKFEKKGNKKNKVETLDINEELSISD
jgi:hypothetical protein